MHYLVYIRYLCSETVLLMIINVEKGILQYLNLFESISQPIFFLLKVQIWGSCLNSGLLTAVILLAGFSRYPQYEAASSDLKTIITEYQDFGHSLVRIKILMNSVDDSSYSI